MVIVNEKIQEYITAIELEENKQQRKINSLNDIKRALVAIHITKKEKSNDKGGYDMVDNELFDSLLNEKLADARRQAIYDKNVKLWTDHKTDSKV